MVAQGPDSGAHSVKEHLAPRSKGLAKHTWPAGRFVDGCHNRPKCFADRPDLVWGRAYLLMALSHVEEGEVPCLKFRRERVASGHDRRPTSGPGGGEAARTPARAPARVV